MNAKEIVDKFKEILLSKNEEVELKERDGSNGFSRNSCRGSCC